MSLELNLRAFAQAVGVDIGAIITSRGDLANLSTTAKNNLVAAINELKGIIDQVDTRLIDDASTAGDRTWSSSKITAMLAQVKTDILDGAPAAFDTLKEISDYLASNTTAVDGLLTAINNRVRFDAAQTLTTAQQLQACTNIGVGDPEVDLVAVYTTAKA